MKYSFKRLPVDYQNGFSLVEILVAMSILAVLMVMLSQIMMTSTQTVSHALSTADAIGQCRQVLDRFGNDWDNRVRRSEAPLTVIKNLGNDTISFYSSVDGFSAADVRPHISQVDYVESSDATSFFLTRGVLNTSWSTSSPLLLGVTTLPLISSQPGGSNYYQLLSDDVCRFEVCFILKSTGQIVARQPTNLQDMGAVVISLAAIDHTTRMKLTLTQITQLTNALADATDGTATPADEWNSYLSSEGQTLPRLIQQNVHVCQRVYYVR